MTAMSLSDMNNNNSSSVVMSCIVDSETASALASNESSVEYSSQSSPASSALKAKNYRVRNTEWHCVYCEIYCNSQSQYDVHAISQKHKLVVEKAAESSESGGAAVDDNESESKRQSSSGVMPCITIDCNNTQLSITSSGESTLFTDQNQSQLVDENNNPITTLPLEKTSKEASLDSEEHRNALSKARFSIEEIANNPLASLFHIDAVKYLIPADKKKGKFEKFGFYCYSCDAYMTGQIQLIMHVRGAKHCHFHSDEIPGYKPTKQYNPCQHRRMSSRHNSATHIIGHHSSISGTSYTTNTIIPKDDTSQINSNPINRMPDYKNIGDFTYQNYLTNNIGASMLDFYGYQNAEIRRAGIEKQRAYWIEQDERQQQQQQLVSAANSLYLHHSKTSTAEFNRMNHPIIAVASAARSTNQFPYHHQQLQQHHNHHNHHHQQQQQQQHQQQIQRKVSSESVENLTSAFEQHLNVSANTSATNASTPTTLPNPFIANYCGNQNVQYEQSSTPTPVDHAAAHQYGHYDAYQHQARQHQQHLMHNAVANFATMQYPIQAAVQFVQKSPINHNLLSATQQQQTIQTSPISIEQQQNRLYATHGGVCHEENAVYTAAAQQIQPSANYSFYHHQHPQHSHH